MTSDGVVSVWILSRIEQHLHDRKATELRCEGKRPVAVLSVGIGKQATGILDASQSRGDGQIDPGAAPDQRVHPLELGIHDRGSYGAVGIGSVIA